MREIEQYRVSAHNPNYLEPEILQTSSFGPRVKKLRDWQLEVLSDTLDSNYVSIQAPCGSGKTTFQILNFNSIHKLASFNSLNSFLLPKPDL